jgi:SpoVK/Ycf46/Vps4 family AAA+-type ATPase
VLLYGPPGTGKTLLPAACAAALGCPLLELRLTDVVRAEVGAGEKELAATFAGAKLVAPCIVFIDEFQAIFTSRSQAGGAGGPSGGSGSVGSTLTSALAACFDEVLSWNSSAGSGALITVIAATNEPWAVDRGFLRPGRLARALFVGPLSLEDRIAFVRSALGPVGAHTHSHTPQTASDSDCGNGPDTTETLLAQVGALSEGFTGADVALLVRRARLLAQHATEGRDRGTGAGTGRVEVKAAHLLQALQQGGICRSVTEEELEEYREWREDEYGST